MKKYSSTKWFMALTGMFGVLMTVTAPAAVLTLSPTDDTMLLGTTGGLPNNNYGDNVALWVQGTNESAMNNSLLRFDLSSLPDGAVVTSVVLGLYLNSASTSTSTWVGVFALSPLNYGWIEGDGTAGSGSTFNEISSGNPWPAGSAGAVTTPFGATNPSLLTQMQFRNASGFTPINSYYSSSNIYNASIFSQWETHGAAEILLEATTTGSPRATFSSSEGSFAPKLEITYTVVPEPGTGSLVLLSALLGVFALRRRQCK